MNYADDEDTVSEDTVTVKGPKPKKRRKQNGKYKNVVSSGHPIFMIFSSTSDIS